MTTEQVRMFATRARTRLKCNDTPALREQVIETATSLGVGQFHIWFEVFSQDTDMQDRLCAAFRVPRPL